MATTDSPQEDAAAPLVGRTLGEFAITGALGRGGMGCVYRATQASTRREVALKVIHPHLVGPALVARFAREAAALGRLAHPNIVTIHTHGEHDGVLFLAMERVDGPTLGALLACEGPLASDRARGLFAQLAEALAHAHAAGVVHRDLKPGNVLIGATLAGALPKIVDFGLAKLADEGGQLTQSGRVMGSAATMSPEQWQDARAIDGATDVYSLGCMMYEALTGVPPFAASSPVGYMRAHLGPRPVDPAHHRPELAGDPLVGWVRACLERDPAARPTAEALWRGLSGERPSPAPEPTRGGDWSAPDAGTLPGDDDLWAGDPWSGGTSPPADRPDAPRRRSPWPFAFALLALAGAAGFGWAAIRPPPLGATPAPPPAPPEAPLAVLSEPDVLTPLAAEGDAVPTEPDASPPAAAVPVRVTAWPIRATVSLDGRPLPREADGSVTLDVPADGEATVAVAAPGFAPAEHALDAAAARALPDGALVVRLRPLRDRPRPPRPDAGATDRPPRLDLERLEIR